VFLFDLTVANAFSIPGCRKWTSSWCCVDPLRPPDYTSKWNLLGKTLTFRREENPKGANATKAPQRRIVWITKLGVTGVAPSIWQSFQERVARLYEQDAPPKDIRSRVGQYVRRWKAVGGGVCSVRYGLEVDLILKGYPSRIQLRATPRS